LQGAQLTVADPVGIADLNAGNPIEAPNGTQFYNFDGVNKSIKKLEKTVKKLEEALAKLSGDTK